MALDGVLANIPGLAGYLAVQQNDQRQALGGLQGVMQLMQAAEQAQTAPLQRELLKRQIAAKEGPVKVGDRLVMPDGQGGFKEVYAPAKQPNWQLKEIKAPDGGIRTVQVDMNAPDPIATARDVSTQGARMEMVNTGGSVTPVNPYQPPAGPLQKTPEIPQGFTRGPNGQLVIDPGYLAGKATIAAAGASRVNVNNLQEREEAKTVGKGFGEQFNTILESARDAQNRLNRFDRIEQLLTGVTTGKMTPTTTQIAALADSVGIKIDPKLGEKQAAAALANEIALQLRNPSGGAGMPGALSDRDREFLVSMTPSLANTEEGNKLLIETARKLATRDKKVAELARSYRQRKGQMDEGFYSELESYSSANPLFGNQQRPASAPAENAAGGWSIRPK